MRKIVGKREEIHMAQSMGCEFTELVSDKGVLTKTGDKVMLKGPLDRKKTKNLHEAARCAAVAPDEGRRLDKLCAAARDFTKTLAPYVTRRRRDEDPLIKQFRTHLKLADGRPHPHRRLERVQIRWAETIGRSSPWLDVLFAAECMSESARGLRLKDTENWPRAVRDAYTKLSAGHRQSFLRLDQGWSTPRLY
ncbi:hypothetical protein IVB12_07810 [Bradyrhizobium sp. 179]|uniref:hypothetical protein n=1 Tax=Bradyrhizobium sp. 179 TaxID=2782648 RepID=UPI001FF766CB|nr:hypothetical protein [Bradyrhizobium sp. 179]MCK1541879.1 hypothetical protein [Bradyrhizobium sp. 179]